MTKPHRLSASQITTYIDCPRKWAWQKIAKVEYVGGKGAALGSQVHNALQKYYETGELDLTTRVGEIIEPALPYIPERSPDLIIEKSFNLYTPIAHYYGLRDLYMPPIDGNIPLVLDHKTTADFSYAKKEEELRSDPQAILYAAHTLKDTGAEAVDLQWNYMRTRGAPKSKQVHLRLIQSDVTPVLDCIDQIAEEMLYHFENQSNPLALTPNLNHCDCYGGCPHRDLCNISQEERMNHIMSDSPTNNLLQSLLLRKTDDTVVSINPPEFQPPPAPPSEVVTVVDAPIAKGKRAKKIAEAIIESAEKAQPASTGYNLYIDCYPVGVHYLMFETLVVEANLTLRQSHNVLDYRMIPYEGAAHFKVALLAAVSEGDNIVMNSSTPEAQIVLNELAAGAVQVVRGTR